MLVLEETWEKGEEKQEVSQALLPRMLGGGTGRGVNAGGPGN